MNLCDIVAPRLIAIAGRRPPDFVIGGAERPYLKRWWLIPRNRFFNIYLHKFLRSDDDRALHDHPWANCSIVLSGQYIEHTAAWSRMRRAGAVVLRRPTHAHRVELVGDCCWTLFITGPWVREWGFHCAKGWVPWRLFVAVDDSGSVGRGCDQ